MPDMLMTGFSASQVFVSVRHSKDSVRIVDEYFGCFGQKNVACHRILWSRSAPLCSSTPSYCGAEPFVIVNSLRSTLHDDKQPAYYGTTAAQHWPPR